MGVGRPLVRPLSVAAPSGAAGAQGSRGYKDFAPTELVALSADPPKFALRLQHLVILNKANDELVQATP